MNRELSLLHKYKNLKLSLKFFRKNLELMIVKNRQKVSQISQKRKKLQKYPQSAFNEVIKNSIETFKVLVHCIE